MAKKSAIENNLRKQRLVKKFAARRKRLLDLANDQDRKSTRLNSSHRR